MKCVKNLSLYRAKKLLRKYVTIKWILKNIMQNGYYIYKFLKA